MRNRCRELDLLLGVCIAAVLLGACGAPGPLTIDEAQLAVLAVGYDPMPAKAEGMQRLAVLPGQPVTIPDTPAIELAVDRKVTWGQVRAVLAPMKAKGQVPIFLVAKGQTLQAFHLNDELNGPIVQAYAELTGKICVKHPDIPEAKCNQTLNKGYIDPSFTRELVREAVNGYERTNVDIDLPEGLIWGDLVSTVGGARSCCGDRNIRVKVSDDSY